MLPQRSEIPNGRRPTDVPGQTSATTAGRTSPRSARITASATWSNGRLLRVHHDRAGRRCAARSRAGPRPGRRRATCRPRGTRPHRDAACCARSRSSATRFSPNEIVADLRIPPQNRHGGSSSPASTRSSVSSIGPRHPHPMHFTIAHVAVDLDDDLGRLPGEVVQPVDVLGHEHVQRALALELDEREVRRVRLRVPHLAGAPVLPRPPPDLRIRHVVLQGRGLLGVRVLRPHAVRTAEVGDAGLGRDPRAREHHHVRRVAQPRRDRDEVFRHSADSTAATVRQGRRRPLVRRWRRPRP